jgi:hypothetical protein
MVEMDEPLQSCGASAPLDRGERDCCLEKHGYRRDPENEEV